MRLKTLEIKGFKSFADETVIHFDEDVIGIVGPNGSGKSNIVDAIRWVLGEQKGKELRLDNMGDVLFNGTRKRKKGGIAQVAITFENTRNILPTEYHTVTVSRILYRSGESEYRLNGVTCRLKDIKALLMDTGIGSNSYAIIALGMVDDILHNKENARRRMFEQAAGISKYKRRKHETMLKLKNTKADLDRVEDLLFEIEGNLKMLEKQARRTRRFTEIKAKYKDQAIDLSIRKTSDLNTRFKELSKQIDTEKDVLRQHEADLAKREARLEQIKKDNLDEEKAVSANQRELNILVGKIRSLENDKGLKEQESVFLQDSVKKLEQQLEQSAAKLKELAVEIESGTHELQRFSKDTDAKKASLEEALAHKQSCEADYQQAKANRDNVTSAQKEIESGYIELEKTIASQMAQISQTEGQLTSLQAEEREIQQEVQARTDESKTLYERASQLQEELDRRQAQEDGRKATVAQLQQQIDDLRDKLSRKQRVSDAKKHERDLLKDMIEKLEGFPDSIKFLNKSKKWDAKAPLLSDVIYCEPQHRVIVEHLLASHLNDYVVDTVEQAAEAVKLLSSAQKGQANFFVLDRITDKKSKEVDVPHATRLTDLVQCDAKYQQLVDTLLGDAWITDRSPLDDIYKGKELRKCTMIDMTGGICVRPNEVSGGSVGLFEGKKLGRAKNLEKLNVDLRELEGEITELREEISALDVEKQLILSEDKSAEIDELRREAEKCGRELAQSSAVADRLKTNEQQIVQRHKEAEGRVEQLKAELSINRRRLTELKQQMKDDATLWQSADAEYTEFMTRYSDANAAYNEANLSYVQMKNHVEGLEREVKYLEKRRMEIQDQRDRDETQKENDLQSIGSLQNDLEAIADSLIDLYAEKKQKEGDLTQAEQAYFEARNEIQTLEDKIRNKSRERQNSQYLINQLKEEHNDVRFKLASVNERLQIEFNTRLEEVLDRELDETVPIETLEVMVDKLRNRLENYGEINPMAVEAFDEMKERYDTINAQKVDILEARDSLLETISEIEETATVKFNEAFSQAREYFIQVFRSLFTEDDSCDLLLEDPENPLESKIRIIAKPKGKRPKSLSQLSGGEKTLTATALLFALYLLKPAPFCVFDEVDAPLDDANIHKFNKIIKKFSEDSQFIIVTHNKQTMAAVDVIYGVYMEEQGVSNLSQVDFRYLDEEAVLETVPA